MDLGYVFVGLPQGSVLSPLLFNMYTADIHNFSNFTTVQYADDFCIYTQNKNYDISLKHLAAAFANIIGWSKDNGFDISSDKSVFSVFTRHNTPNVNFINLQNHVIPFKKEVKYLGIFLDKKLTWKKHIEHIITKSEKGINFLRSIMRTWWGCDVQTSIIFYKSYIRSILDYGSILYGSACKSLLNKIDRVQYKALRVCLGAMRSSPVEALLVEALEPPLCLRRESLSAKFLFKHTFFNTDLIINIRKLNEYDLTNKYWLKKNSPPLCEAFRSHNVALNQIQTFHPTDYEYYSVIEPVTVKTPSFTNNALANSFILKEELSNFKDSILIYTDASKSLEGNGAAFYCPTLNVEHKYKINKECSIFTTEALAILEALNFVLVQNYLNFVIMSDSMSVLKTLSKTKPWSYKINSIIWNIRKLLRRLTLQKKCVTFVWVKAHTGLPGNEYVDWLAKDGIFNGTATDCYFHICDAQNILKITLKNKWNERWDNYRKSTQTRYSLILNKIPEKYWHKEIVASRRYITTIIRLKLGHACYPAHLNKIKVLATDLCDKCQVRSDLDHIFFECKKHTAQIQNLFDALFGLKVNCPFNLLNLLSLDNPNIYNALIFFLNSINLKL